MEQINKFNLKIDEIEKMDNLDEKSKSVKLVKDELKTEKEKVEEMIDKIASIQPKKSKKFKGLSLDKLNKMFDDEESLEEKLVLYQHISYLIESTKNQLFDN